jgi:hypothetical protein
VPAGLREAVDVYYAGIAESVAVELAGADDAGYWLGQVALESVIAQRMADLAVVSMHRALLAGATLAQVADAAGMTCAGAAERWRSWADGQRQLKRQVPGLGLSERDYLRAAAAAGARTGPAPESGHASTERRIGSPRPLSRPRLRER